MSVVIPSLRGAIAVPGWAKNELWRKARAVPSLDLRFADSKSLTDATTGAQLVTFTRASSGTFVGSDGVLRTAVTNLLLRSEEFGTTWAPANLTVTSNSLTAPNGTLTADTLVEDASLSTHLVQQAVNVVSGTTYTLSCYAKPAGRNFAQLLMLGGFAANITALIDITNGTVGTTGGSPVVTSVNVGNGWYRLSITATATSTTSTTVQLRPSSTSSTAFYQGDGTSGIYLWGAQLEQSATVGEYIPTTSTINSAPRFDHNPTTGESLGLLVEEQRTNSIRNNTMVGAVAGTPGTAPTNWVVTGTSGVVTRTIVGTGTENGIAYIDIQYQFSGGGNAFVNFEGGTQIAAASGQSWTGSHYCKLQTGSNASLTFQTTVIGYSNAGAALEFNSTAFTPTTAGLLSRRFLHTRTLSNASTAFVSANIGITASAAADITLRIGLPQLEQGAFATSPILTTTAAATRSADVASIGSSAFTSFYNQSEGTVFAESQISGASNETGIAGLTNAGETDFLRVSRLQTTLRPRSLVFDDSALQADTQPTNTIAIGQAFKLATVLKQNDFSTVLNGGSAAVDTSGTIPTVDRMTIGTGAFLTQLNGTIKRLCYWRQALPGSTLQAITG